MTFKDKLIIFLRSFLLQAGWNYLRYQSIGFTFIMLPTLRKIYKKRDLKSVILRYLENFNTHPVMASYAYGALLRFEKDEVAKQKFKRSEWVITKSFLMSSLASIGDRFFWDTLKPFAFIFALFTASLLHLDLFKFSQQVAFTTKEALGAAALYLLIYNIPALYVRWKGLGLSYNSDADSCYGLLSFDWNRAIRIIKSIGFVCTLLIVAFTLAGQFLYLDLGEEFFLLSSVLLFFVLFSLLAEKINVPIVYVYLAATVVFCTVMIIL